MMLEGLRPTKWDMVEIAGVAGLVGLVTGYRTAGEMPVRIGRDDFRIAHDKLLVVSDPKDTAPVGSWVRDGEGDLWLKTRPERWDCFDIYDYDFPKEAIRERLENPGSAGNSLRYIREEYESATPEPEPIELQDQATIDLVPPGTIRGSQSINTIAVSPRPDAGTGIAMWISLNGTPMNLTAPEGRRLAGMLVSAADTFEAEKPS